MMLPDRAIREMVWPTNGRHEVFVPGERAVFGPIEEEQIQPASLDVRLGPEIVSHPWGERYVIDPERYYTLRPGKCVLGSLVERLDLRADNVAARIEGKSTWARRFLTVHSAGFIDPGFTGDVTLELKNDGEIDIHLRPGMMIAQISFHFLAAPAERLYGEKGLGSHYQGQIGTTEARNG